LFLNREIATPSFVGLAMTVIKEIATAFYQRSRNEYGEEIPAFVRLPLRGCGQAGMTVKKRCFRGNSYF
jgi:hypothetical protein